MRIMGYIIPAATIATHLRRVRKGRASAAVAQANVKHVEAKDGIIMKQGTTPGIPIKQEQIARSAEAPEIVELAEELVI